MDTERDTDKEVELHGDSAAADEEPSKSDEKKDGKKKKGWTKAADLFTPIPYSSQKGATSGKGKGKGKGDREERDGALKGGRGKGGFDRSFPGDRAGERPAGDRAAERGAEAEPVKRAEDQAGEAPAPRPQVAAVQAAPGPASPPKAPVTVPAASPAAVVEPVAPEVPAATGGFRGPGGPNHGQNANLGGKSKKSGGKPGRDNMGKGYNNMGGKGPGNFGGKSGAYGAGGACGGGCGSGCGGGCGGCGGCGGGFGGGCGGPSSGACGAGGGMGGGPRGGNGGKGGSHKGPNSGMGGPGIGQRGAANAAPPVPPGASEPEAAAEAPRPQFLPARGTAPAASMPAGIAPVQMPMAYGGMPGAFRGMPFAPMGMAPYGYDAAMQYQMPYAYGAQMAQMPAFFVMPGAMPGGPPFLGPGLTPMGLIPQTTVDRVQLKEQVRQQIEYYFGQENLIKDIHLRRNCMDRQGWVAIATLAGFRRIQNMTMDQSIIMEALQEIQSLELDPTRASMRLKEGWEKWVLPESFTDSDSKRA